MTHKTLIRREAEALVPSAVLDRPEVHGLAVYVDTVRVFGPGCKWPGFDALPDGIEALYVKNAAHALPDSRTQRALAMMDANPRLSRYAAAHAVGISPAAVTRALQRRARASLKLENQS